MGALPGRRRKGTGEGVSVVVLELSLTFNSGAAHTIYSDDCAISLLRAYRTLPCENSQLAEIPSTATHTSEPQGSLSLSLFVQRCSWLALLSSPRPKGSSPLAPNWHGHIGSQLSIPPCTPPLAPLGRGPSHPLLLHSPFISRKLVGQNCNAFCHPSLRLRCTYPFWHCRALPVLAPQPSRFLTRADTPSFGACVIHSLQSLFPNCSLSVLVSLHLHCDFKVTDCK